MRGGDGDVLGRGTCDEHRVTYGLAESLYCMPITRITVNCTGIKVKNLINKKMPPLLTICVRKREEGVCLAWGQLRDAEPVLTKPPEISPLGAGGTSSPFLPQPSLL